MKDEESRKHYRLRQTEISIFVDESGGQGGKPKYYILALVFHDQKDGISVELDKYRKGL